MHLARFLVLATSLASTALASFAFIITDAGGDSLTRTPNLLVQ